MYCYKVLNADGTVYSLETRNQKIEDSSSVEITESEYQSLMEEMLANTEQELTDQISDSEALEIITGGVTE